MYLKLLAASAATVVGLVLIRKYKEYTWGKCTSKRSVKNKTVIITGANCGLGKATALDLAQRGARVILACRDQEKAHKALVDIRSKSNSGILKVMELDLASFESIKKFANEFMRSEERLDILINNAGVFQCPFMTTKEGYEMHFGVNHLGHFLLTKLLMEKLKQSSPSRIVIVSSALYKRGTLNFENINSEKHYDKSMAYKNSKLANVLFSRELAKRLKGTGVSVYAVSPGMVWTNIGRYMSLNWWKIAALALLLGSLFEHQSKELRPYYTVQYRKRLKRKVVCITGIAVRKILQRMLRMRPLRGSCGMCLRLFVKSLISLWDYLFLLICKLFLSILK